jgi:hypothetical protein
VDRNLEKAVDRAKANRKVMLQRHKVINEVATLDATLRRPILASMDRIRSLRHRVKGVQTGCRREPQQVRQLPNKIKENHPVLPLRKVMLQDRGFRVFHYSTEAESRTICSEFWKSRSRHENFIFQLPFLGLHNSMKFDSTRNPQLTFILALFLLCGFPIGINAQDTILPNNHRFHLALHWNNQGLAVKSSHV